MNEPDRVIFSSYGNDSITLINWVGSRSRMGRVIVAYSGTGWAKPSWEKRVLQGEEYARGFGFETVRIESEGMVPLIRRKKAWPRGGGGTFQFCTHELKQAPALRWLDEIDPSKSAICTIGIRREESRNRATFPEWTECSERHGGRPLHAPLVNMLAWERNMILTGCGFTVLPHRSRECYPCVNMGKRELRLLDQTTISKIDNLEQAMGINSAGNALVMFSPDRHGGAVGIRAVVEEAKRASDDIFSTICDGGWCE